MLTRWRAGDTSAGNRLFERYFDNVFRFFAHKVDEREIEDLVQRTFLACVEARDRLRRASSFRSFLFGIARYELLYHWRKKRRTKLDPLTTTMQDLRSSPSTLVALADEQRQLLQALRSIPIDLQVAVELHYWEEMTSREIGEVLDIPRGTAQSRLRRAREALEAALAASEQANGSSVVEHLDDWARSLRDVVLGG